MSDHETGPRNDLDQLGDRLLRTAADHDPDFQEPDEGERIRVVLDQREAPPR